MKSRIAFVLGLLVGLLGTRALDWLQLRPESGPKPQGADRMAQQPGAVDSRRADLEPRLAAESARAATLEAKLAAAQTHSGAMDAQHAADATRIAELETQLAAAETVNAEQARALQEQAAAASHLQERLAVAEEELATLRPADAAHPAEPAAEDPAVEPTEAEPGSSETAAADERARDNLTLIKGVGPGIAGRLNSAGIHTFRALAELDAEGLRAVVGHAISQLADEEDILRQARERAAAQEQKPKPERDDA